MLTREMTDNSNYMEMAYGQESVGLFYNPNTNTFVDEDGFIIWSIFEIISPNDLYLFKRHKEYMLAQHQTVSELLVEVFYLEEGDQFD